MDNFICPHCQSKLELQNRSLKCQNNHCFDLAKEGYVNLLPVNSKKTKDPGDNTKMMTARREFLSSGQYKPLAEKLALIIEEITAGEKAVILDLGCGEGYYTGYIKERNKNLDMMGLDISKAAVRYASKRYKDIDFCVASAFDLPLKEASLDMIVRIYAPSSESELSRTLKTGGNLITVTPGERHLYQLRERIYKEIHDHSEESKPINHFIHEHRFKLNYSINIVDFKTVKNLLEMTPFGWKISEKDAESLYSQVPWEIECDFNIDVYKKE